MTTAQGGRSTGERHRPTCSRRLALDWIGSSRRTCRSRWRQALSSSTCAPIEQRLRDGELPGAIVIDRNVLEWRLDPTCPHHIPEASDARARIIVVCSEGYGSSLAAATLQDLGLRNATDLVGGFQALGRCSARER